MKRLLIRSGLELVNLLFHHAAFYALCRWSGRVRSVFCVHPASEKYADYFGFRFRQTRAKWTPYLIGMSKQRNGWTLMYAVSATEPEITDPTQRDNLRLLNQRLETLARRAGEGSTHFAGVVPSLMKQRGIERDNVEQRVTVDTVLRAVRSLDPAGTRKTLVLLGARGYIGACVMAANVQHEDSSHELRRRGRNLQTGLPTTLASILQPGFAGRFAELFDLTHANLAPGAAAEFLKAEGTFGSLMFAARTGISPIRLQQARLALDKALKEIDSARKGGDGIPHRRARYKDALARSRELARFDASDEHDAKLRACSARIDVADDKLTGLDRESRRLQGLVNGADTVKCLKQARLELKGFPPGATLLTSARIQELQAALNGADDARERMEKARIALQEARRAFDLADEPGLLHDLSPQCEQLRQIVAEFGAGLTRLKELEEQSIEKRRELKQVLERLGPCVQGDVEEAARGQLCPEPLARQLADLIERHEDLQLRWKQERSECSSAQSSLEALGEQEADPADLATDVLVQALTALTRERTAEAELAQLHERLPRAERMARDLKAELKLGADANTPDALALPSLQTAQQLEGGLIAARDTLKQLEGRVRQQQDELSALQQRMSARRASLGSVASADEVERARLLRDQHLTDLHSSLVAPTAARVGLAELAGRADVLGQLVRQADLLVDGRVLAGEKLGELRGDEDRERESLARLEQVRLEQDKARQAQNGAEQAVADLWSVLDEPPVSAEAWFQRFEQWRAAWGEHQDLMSKVTLLEERLAASCRDAVVLAGELLPKLTGLTGVHAMHELIEDERRKRERQADRQQTLAGQRKLAGQRLVAARMAADAARQELEAWKAEWEAAMQNLPAPVPRDVVPVRTWVELQAELRRVVADTEAVVKRRDDARGTTAERQERIEAFLVSARSMDPGINMPDDIDPVSGYRLVDNACKSSVARLQEWNQLEKDRARAEQDLSAREEESKAATVRLQQVWDDVGSPGGCDQATIDQLAEQAQRVKVLRDTIGQCEAELRGRWPGVVDESLAELEAHGVDVLDAQRKDVEAERAQLKAAREDMAQERAGIQSPIAAMARDASATSVTQELTDAREALFDKLEERYQLQVAELILLRAFEEAAGGGQAIQEEASRYFGILTNGAYSGLYIDHEGEAGSGGGGGARLLALDSDGREKSIDELSAGTCDQIWLALRLAGIVAAARETPFPLLLDDSLVQFDDARARAALELLHTVSEHAQVIVFTHHDHLANLAEAQIPQDDLAVVVLPSVTGEMRARAAADSKTGTRERPVMEESGQGGTAPAVGIEVPLLAARSRRCAADDLEWTRQLILQVLAGAGEMLGKDAVLNHCQEIAPDLDVEKFWSRAIKDLVDSQSVLREGERKGARYQLPVVDDSRPH